MGPLSSWLPPARTVGANRLADAGKAPLLAQKKSRIAPEPDEAKREAFQQATARPSPAAIASQRPRVRTARCGESISSGFSKKNGCRNCYPERCSFWTTLPSTKAARSKAWSRKLAVACCSFRPTPRTSTRLRGSGHGSRKNCIGKAPETTHNEPTQSTKPSLMCRTIWRLVVVLHGCSQVGQVAHAGVTVPPFSRRNLASESVHTCVNVLRLSESGFRL